MKLTRSLYTGYASPTRNATLAPAGSTSPMKDDDLRGAEDLPPSSPGPGHGEALAEDPRYTCARGKNVRIDCSLGVELSLCVVCASGSRLAGRSAPSSGVCGPRPGDLRALVFVSSDAEESW
mmetsp:Transcript_21151/g.58295  ORF Transcript_21151/g.58295 Transcript_21151/m.58295 type:complete len:122 (+) Transcript_21151:849-1214(+)